MTRKKSRRLPIVLLVILVLLLLVFLLGIVKNQGGSRLEDLSATDQAILTEYNTLYASLRQEDIWTGYALEDKTILAMPGSWGGGYLINPTQPVSGLFAKEIALPEDWDITVYRVAAVTPGLMAFRFEGSLNTIGKDYALFGSPVYFVKYDEASVTEPWSNLHFACFLSHEAFHYYMQEGWPEGSRFSTEGLTDGDIALLEEEYDILCQVQAQLLSGDPDQAALEEAARAYVAVMDRRLAANPDYVQQELDMETMEGTATYVGIQASRRVGYDFGIMYFSNQKDMPMDQVIPQYQAGNLDKSFLADRMPYETGGLLCLLMDALAIPDWQAALNSQTPEDPVSLYDILKSWTTT